ncbi:hypothetical protein AX774_g955 [Zancudomyces culisetae]|uniref:Uncharacterized protein n=1 Tax=Zancudomyces culisetae TaxID=1213189 RepID=A0A1R1PWU7_ZANCU|nr:hypothetical protein AX774_g955 [Zancudomyces culisetae]|eukprot:OMH85465.1 hypothetical protein AX774_g955 [Zancudomyces culisetae]
MEKYPDGSPYSRVPRMLYLYFKQGHWRSKEVKNVLPTRHSNEASLESPVQTEGHELNYFRSFTNTTQQNNNASMQFPGGNYTSEGNELRNSAAPMEAPGESKTSEHSDSASFETLRERIFREAKPDYLSFSAANPAGKVKYMVHIHHWQLFYILAFFTRFPTTVSRICAGLVLGIYTQGCVAYGHGEILETL